MEILFPLAAICLLADLILSASWSGWYFSSGPVLIRSIRFVAQAKDVPSAVQLETKATSFLLGRTLFRDFGADFYIFRRSLLGGSSLLYGELEFSQAHHTVVVRGRLSLFSGGFLACWLLAAALSGSPEFFGFGVLIMAGLFTFETFEIHRALSIAVKLWSHNAA